MSKDLPRGARMRELARRLLKAGWSLQQRKSGHWAATPPGGTRSVFIPDKDVPFNRSTANVASLLRRAGASIPRKTQ